MRWPQAAEPEAEAGAAMRASTAGVGRAGSGGREDGLGGALAVTSVPLADLMPTQCHLQRWVSLMSPLGAGRV